MFETPCGRTTNTDGKPFKHFQDMINHIYNCPHCLVSVGGLCGLIEEINRLEQYAVNNNCRYKSLNLVVLK